MSCEFSSSQDESIITLFRPRLFATLLLSCLGVPKLKLNVQPLQCENEPALITLFIGLESLVRESIGELLGEIILVIWFTWLSWSILFRVDFCI